MNPLTIAGALVCAVAAHAAEPTYASKRLTADEAIADIDLAERVLSVVHPGYERYTVRAELDAIWASLRAESAGGTTDADLYLGVSRALEAIRCDHTKAEYPDSLAAHRNTTATHPAFRPHVFGDRLFAGVNAIDGLEEGDEILSINGLASSALIREARAMVPIDGYTDHAKDAEVERTSEYQGSALWHFMPLYHGWRDAFTLRVQSADGSERTVESNALTYPRYMEMVRTGESLASEFADAVSVRMIDDDTAVLRVTTFVNYRRPVDANAKFAESIAPLNDAGVGRLIVDLRANGGGSSDASVALARHLIAEPIQVYSGSLVQTVPLPEDIKASITTWDRSVLDATPAMFDRAPDGRYLMKDNGWVTAPPAPDAFKGEVVLLSSRANASGVTMLLGELQQRAGLRVVGEATGGNVAGCTAGIIAFCKLPNSGITVRVPLMQSITKLESIEPGKGVTPDVLVTPTPGDLRAGRDAVLEAALR